MTKKQIASLELAQLSACWKRVPPARLSLPGALADGAVIKIKLEVSHYTSVSSDPCNEHAVFI